MARTKQDKLDDCPHKDIKDCDCFEEPDYSDED